MNQSKLYIFSCLISYRVQTTERDCCTHILSTEFNTTQLHNLNNNLNAGLRHSTLIFLLNCNLQAQVFFFTGPIVSGCTTYKISTS